MRDRRRAAIKKDEVILAVKKKRRRALGQDQDLSSDEEVDGREFYIRKRVLDILAAYGITEPDMLECQKHDAKLQSIARGQEDPKESESVADSIENVEEQSVSPSVIESTSPPQVDAALLF